MPGPVLLGRRVAAEVPRTVPHVTARVESRREGLLHLGLLWPLGLMALGLTLLSPAPALAQNDPEVKAYLLSVRQLYDEGENESALRQIAKARALTHSPADEAALSLYEGIILADQNREDASTEAFKKALRVQPEAKLPVKVSPKVAQRFEQTRKEVKEELVAQAKPPTPAPQPPASQELAANPKPPAPPPAPPRTDRPVQEPQPAPKVAQARPEPKPQGSASASLPDTTVTAEHTGVAKRSFTRPQVLVPAIAGGVLVALGGASWAMSRKELSNLTNGDPSLQTAEDAHQAASRGRTFQSVGVGLLGAGVAGLGFALGSYALGPSSSETALRVGTDGTSAFVQGRWP